MAEGSRWATARAAASTVADFWDAAKFMALSIAAIVVALTATAAFAWTQMPPGFLALLVVGVVGLVLVTITPLARKLLPVSPAPAPAPQTNNPNDRAAALESQHQKRVLAERRALRWVREELLDNRHRLQRVDEGEAVELLNLTDRHWQECEATLLELEDPEPHAKARQAYREIKGVENAQTLLPSDTQGAIKAIDDAVASMSAGE